MNSRDNPLRPDGSMIDKDGFYWGPIALRSCNYPPPKGWKMPLPKGWWTPRWWNRLREKLIDWGF